ISQIPVLGDFNGDGQLDMGITTNYSGISVFLNRPTAVLFPGALAFGSVDVGTTSSSQSVTVGNPGSIPLSITSVAASGDFSASSNCGASLAVGKSCTVDVTFTPKAGGPRNGVLTLTDNAPTTQQIV